MEAYDQLGIMYFYTGNLEKSKYYNDRMCRGKTEAKFSIVRKMSQNHASKKYVINPLSTENSGMISTSEGDRSSSS